MDNPPLANRTDNDMSTETDFDVTDNVIMALSKLKTRPRRLRPETTLGIDYGKKVILAVSFLATVSARAIVLHCIMGWHVSGWAHMEWHVCLGGAYSATTKLKGEEDTNGKDPICLLNVHFNCTAAAERTPWWLGLLVKISSAIFPVVGDAKWSVCSLWRYPVRTAERWWGSYKAGVEVLGLSLILDEANIHRPQILAN